MQNVQDEEEYKAHGKYSISYSTARLTFLQHLSVVTKEKTKDFGLHSLRSGGASAAANEGVPDRLISKQGRWSSTSSRDGYIRDNATKSVKFTRIIKLLFTVVVVYLLSFCYLV